MPYAIDVDSTLSPIPSTHQSFKVKRKKTIQSFDIPSVKYTLKPNAVKLNISRRLPLKTCPCHKRNKTTDP